MTYERWMSKAKILWSNINIPSITPKTHPEVFEVIYEMKKSLDESEISDLPLNRKPFLDMFCEEVIEAYELWKENILNSENEIPPAKAIECLDTASKLYFLIIKLADRK